MHGSAPYSGRRLPSPGKPMSPRLPPPDRVSRRGVTQGAVLLPRHGTLVLAFLYQAIGTIEQNRQRIRWQVRREQLAQLSPKERMCAPVKVLHW